LAAHPPTERALNSGSAEQYVTMGEMNTKDAYAECVALARRHYENFPVASHLIPRRRRGAVAAIYAFARTADDFADEGDLAPAERLARLDAYAEKLEALERGEVPNDAIFIALADAVQRHRLPTEPFHHLLEAFRMDVTKTRYADFGELMAYCRYSANPVGRLLLHLFNAADERNLAHSDAVCSALQLINFLQDLGQDYDENQRIYIPQDELTRFHVGEAHFRERVSDFNMERLMDFQIQRARRLLQAGAPLGLRLTGRFGLEIRMIIMGGSRVLQRLHENRQNAFARPRLRPRDWAWVVWRAVKK